MDGSDDKIAGFALGALLGATESSEPWSNAISPAFAQAVRARLTELSSASDKRAALGALIAQVRPDTQDRHTLPSRAREQLQGSSKRALHESREDYVADADLLAMLRRLAPRLAEKKVP